MPDLVRAIQQQLLKDDCHLIGVINADPRDLVRRAASITASSSQPGAGPDLVRSGQTRSLRPGPAPAPSIDPNLRQRLPAPRRTAPGPDTPLDE